MSDQKSESAESATEPTGKVVHEAISPAIERQLVRNVQSLCAGMETQVDLFPFAELALRKLVEPWIVEAEQVLATFRETGVAPLIDAEVMLARAKLRYWTESVAIQKEYPRLSMMELFDTMHTEIDGFYPADLQRSADEYVDR